MKKLLSILIILTLMLTLTSCGGEAETPVSEATEAPASEAPTQESEESKEAPVSEPAEAAEPAAEMAAWNIYWYLCGSDLETGGGFASGDLQELTQVQLPENVNVIIETGGSAQWQNDFVDASKIQRWVYNSEGLFLAEELPSANMGEAQTLADFLAFSNTYYPAEKTAVVFWNHGGGSVTGAAFDELYGNDSLTLDEMYLAFTSVWNASAEAPPLELVGFDTCLMATVDVAYTFCDLAKFFVASEECEPANGWLYSGWVGALAENPGMDGAELGKIICDQYYLGCEQVGTQDNTTLSLVDSSKVGALLEAYEQFGAEALTAAADDPGFFSQFGRAAFSSENYGGNTKEQGYTNMVDLGHLARQCSGMLGSSQAVLDALDECVLYKVEGPYRGEATGMSCYYSYDGDVDNFNGYAALGAGEAFKYFYAYELNGELDEAGMEYADGLDIEALPAIENLTTMGWDEMPLDLDENGNSVLNLGPDAANILSTIGFQLYNVDEEADVMMLLGTDNDIVADWDNGVFTDNFRGVWGSIDGALVYMELSFEGDDYNLYSVPVLLNGEEYNLQVVYDYTYEQWTILGGRQGLDDSGMADKELRLLEVGDEITTIWQLATYSGDDDFEQYQVETLTVTEDTAFYESQLFDGEYILMFEMRDAMGNSAYSDIVQFSVEAGEIYTTIFE